MASNALTYKIVTLNYTEQASLVIRADTNEAAEAVIWEDFPNIPNLQILSIEDAPDELVEELKAQRAEEDVSEDSSEAAHKRTLN